MNNLKKYLIINSIFSAISGLIMLLFSLRLNALFNLDQINVFPFIGANLLVFAVFVSIVSFRYLTNKTLVNAITFLDMLWVLASIIIVSFGLFNLSKIGYILISGVALWIAYLVYKQCTFTKA